MEDFTTQRLSAEPDAMAPDGSEIRYAATMSRGSVVHCRLPPGTTSKAVVHKTVEEIWYFLQGIGQVWRRQGDREEVVEVLPGSCVTIPTGTQFQFRNPGGAPLCFVITTMPPWPGPDEAVRVEDYWPTDRSGTACS